MYNLLFYYKLCIFKPKLNGSTFFFGKTNQLRDCLKSLNMKQELFVCSYSFHVKLKISFQQKIYWQWLFMNLLNYVPHVLPCATCLVPYVLSYFTCLVPYLLSCLTSLVPLCLTCLVPYVLSYLTCLVDYVYLSLMYSCTSRVLCVVFSWAARAL